MALNLMTIGDSYPLLFSCDYFLIFMIIAVYVNAIIYYKCLWYIFIWYDRHNDSKVKNINWRMLALVDLLKLDIIYKYINMVLYYKQWCI